MEVGIDHEAQFSLSTLLMEGRSFMLYRKIVMEGTYLYVLELYSFGRWPFYYFFWFLGLVLTVLFLLLWDRGTLYFPLCF
jgi:hypothetical protein